MGLIWLPRAVCGEMTVSVLGLRPARARLPKRWPKASAGSPTTEWGGVRLAVGLAARSRRRELGRSCRGEQQGRRESEWRGARGDGREATGERRRARGEGTAGVRRGAASGVSGSVAVAQGVFRDGRCCRRSVCVRFADSACSGSLVTTGYGVADSAKSSAVDFGFEPAALAGSLFCAFYLTGFRALKER